MKTKLPQKQTEDNTAFDVFFNYECRIMKEELKIYMRKPFLKIRNFLLKFF